MVLQRKLYYGFSGYEVPIVPRASRSARGKVPIRKTHEDNQVRAFEILASIAGKLLQDTDSSAPNIACGDDQTNNVEWEKKDKGKLLKTEPLERETIEENSFPYVHGLQGHHQTDTVKELSHADKIFSFDANTISKNLLQPEKICFAGKFPYVTGTNLSGSYFATVSGDFPCSRKSGRGRIISAIEPKFPAELLINRSKRSEKIYSATKWPNFNGRSLCRGPSGKVCGESPQSRLLVKACLDTEELYRKPPALVSSDRNLRTSLFRVRKNFGCFSKYFADTEVARRDDDKISVWRSQPGTRVTAYKPSPNVVHRSSGNPSWSGHQSAAPNMKDWKRKPVYFNGRSHNTHQRSHRISSTKRRKLFNQIPLSTSDGGFQRKDIFNSLDNGSNDDNNCGVKEASFLAGSQQAPHEPPGDCNVKLSIKSLKVPELLIDIPATATVGSLKRTVMEAVTAVLGDGLHVGVRLQGKTVRDDSKTLLQTGICHGDKHHRLGFVLEPRHVHITPPPLSNDCLLLSDGTSQGLTGHMMSMSVEPVPSDVIPLPQLMKTRGSVDNYSTAVQSIDNNFINNTMPDSQALVAVPAVAMEALAVVPFHKKSKHHEFVQRRTRRPFSVLEVEALVQAVEKLGTGRWRDVKLHAFDSAKHRTYVDLKDKWKTLVHTARISPQQRRGEPVPQQLLDRVLAAHAFWSQQQAQARVKEAV